MDARKILPGIDSPEDIRKLTVEELGRLASEIRQVILETVSRNGGHLAPSLGTVELTLAIHYVFDTPRDRLIWDVGHQAYAHKIITGRRDRFHTLRRMGGISGFPKREESPYDVFNVGHSSTSISAAAGIAEGRCLTGEDFKVIAVIGDGSMTAGMAYEALNWAGDRDKDLIIILNDNEMSISPNVGALSSYLNRIMTGQHVMKWRAEVKNFLKTIPGIGEQMLKFTKQAEESLKGLVVPGVLFEELGFQYVGPLEGHRLDHLIANLQNVRELKKPVLVHVVTKKGKGYVHAEREPSKFHGIGPFDVVSGEVIVEKGAPPSYTEVFGKAMLKLARENQKVVAVTAAMCQGTGLEEFSRQLPDRFYDVGIAEQHGVTFAAGLATLGFVPVVAIYSTFLQRAYDQVFHDVCLQKLPVVFALDRGGFVGDDGPTHHGLFDYSYLRSLPNIVMMAPKDENELQRMLKTAVGCGGPASVRYPRGKGVGVPLDETPARLEIGRGEVLREGNDIALFAIGSTVYPALDAARELAREGIDVEVVNCRFIKPMDEVLLCDTALRLKKVVTVEENVLMGGFGSAVLELFEKKGLCDIKVKRLGVGDEFVQHATQAQLRRLYGVDAEGIAKAVREFLGAQPLDARNP
ncbi:MAG: 1-deoxy-D-xylulose-5-phosphate synthase [Syntrophobacterales bacterium]|jgi:1-deoxy-D-xylulose-5-phosphate synthase|nr:1-deoxy-D-xylulose-5-phosphate synthase [Syntrophobacterales bacterium]